ncbi:MAG: site-specific DNA-methyltransferase [Candidatus Zixiibacteriota bacterium]|nr:MAG: site-specific DNA-methyltransferase [candidate division Zixibacteria bacterium]
MLQNPLPRLDRDTSDIRQRLLPHCRLKQGEVWHDPEGKHLVACGDASDQSFLRELFGDSRAALAVQDPPYNLVAFETRSIEEYIAWSRVWVDNCHSILTDDSSLYVWLGADQNNHFQPLGQFITMMATSGFRSRSFITMRNQRGYGTQSNWMAVRQELLYYTLGHPFFQVQYTDIPKILRGYYKDIDGHRTENIQRGRSMNIRAGNVWVDLQQVFYRLQENVSGCYAQKPLRAIERIVLASTVEGDLVTDFFAGSGTTLLACERNHRRCITFDSDPIFTEITIRRLEQFRATGKTGWQSGNPFEHELCNASSALQSQTAPIATTTEVI